MAHMTHQVIFCGCRTWKLAEASFICQFLLQVFQFHLQLIVLQLGWWAGISTESMREGCYQHTFKYLQVLSAHFQIIFTPQKLNSVNRSTNTVFSNLKRCVTCLMPEIKKIFLGLNLEGNEGTNLDSHTTWKNTLYPIRPCRLSLLFSES